MQITSHEIIFDENVERSKIWNNNQVSDSELDSLNMLIHFTGKYLADPDQGVKYVW